MSDTPDLSGIDKPQDPEDDMYFDRPLKEYARDFSYPPTPNIAASVRERLDPDRAKTNNRGTTLARPRLAWVAVAVVVLSLGAALFTPDVRAFVRSILRIGSVDIVFATPTATVFTTPGTPAPARLPTVLENLDGRTTLLAARTRARFPLKTPSYPADLGLPDLVYLQDPQSMVVFVWLDPQQPDKALLSLFEIVEGRGLAEKMVSSPEVVEETTVNGERAAWVRGPHYLVFVNPDRKTEFQERMLVEGNVLLWQEGDITYRLETGLPREEAIKIAESLVELPR
ncbi:MAG: DUF4367 domain-containing protein [Chloroflexota bacterium]|nr:DUF4367 domain-containing protein [Chloroflexota bacterium]